jgi:CRISPR-associated protein (TIGR03986 family)
MDAIPQILSTPKPTTFQHYLVQTSDFIRELSHYNSGTVLRGHKLYWHRRRDWQAKDLIFDKAGFEKFLQRKGLQIPAEHRTEKNGKVTVRDYPSLRDENLKNAIFEFVMADDKSQYTVIKPIPPGAKFKGRIRFENLTEFELGALLSALQLPENCRHKIGMGKPLGLGSVKITPALFLSNRQQRYTSLLHEWTTVPRPESEETVKNLQAAFERYILERLAASEKPAANKLWDTYRLRQLRVMLDWNNTQKENWNERTRYLEIEHPQNGNEYKTRPVLPAAEEVVKA